MWHKSILLLTCIVLLSSISLAAPEALLSADPAGKIEVHYGVDSEIFIHYSAPDQVINFNETETLPTLTRFIAIPEGYDPVIRIQDVIAEPFFVNDRIKSTLNSEKFVEATDGWTINEIRIIPISFNAYAMVNGEVHKVSELYVEVSIPYTNQTIELSRGLRKSLGNLLLNDLGPHRDQNMTGGGGYVYVIPDNNDISDIIRPLTDWRSRQGFSVRILPVPNFANGELIYRELQTINRNGPAVEYICLVGSQQGAYRIPAMMMGTTDYHYSLLSGESPLPEAAVGRLSYANLGELQRIVEKIMNYELQPDVDDLAWTRRAVVAAGNEISGLSTILVSKWVRDLLLRNQFTEVDTFWYTMGRRAGGFLADAFDRGTAFVNYRGWTGIEDWSPREAGRLNNDKLPVALLLSCNTGDYNQVAPGYTEALLRAPGGAIGAIGTVGAQSRVQYNNALMAGFYRGVLIDGISEIGWALNNAKVEMFAIYGRHGYEWSISHMYWTNLMGDPGTTMLRGAPRQVQLEAPDQWIIGGDPFEARVTFQNQPLEGVRVGLNRLGEASVYAITDAEGSVSLTMDPRLVSPGAATVTVSGDRVRTLSRQIQINQPPNLLTGMGSFIIEDNFDPRQGNGNGIANPFETITLNATVRNQGNQVIMGGVNFRLTSQHEGVEVLQAQVFHGGAIQPNQPVNLQFLVGLTDMFPHQTPVRLNIEASSGPNRWNIPVSIQGVAPRWTFFQVIGNLPLSRGAETDISIRLINDGGMDIGFGDGMLVSLSEWAEVTAELSQFDSIYVSRWQQCIDPYVILVSEDAPFGTSLPFELQLIDESQYRGIIRFSLEVERAPATIPSGPDAYGYYAIDAIDQESNVRPQYNWAELDPRLGGNGLNTGILDQGEDDDKSVLLNLPFAFRYFGENFDQITVCSNGWAALGDQREYVNFRNLPIGTPQSPRAMLCPWWDDLYQPGIDGGVFYRYDAENKQFIIEWSQMRRWIGLNGPGGLVTVQLILRDPQWYPSYTGDGEIIFQYRDVAHEASVDGNGTPYATIGISSPDGESGLQYGYWNSYSPGAAAPQRGSAIKFATRHTHQYGAINGTVVRRQNQENISGAIVRTTTGSWAVTDDQGSFVIPNILSGIPFSIIVEATGYNRLISEQMIIAENQNIERSFELVQPLISVNVEQFIDTLDAGMDREYGFRINNIGEGELDLAIDFAESENNMLFNSSVSLIHRDEPNDMWEHLFGWNVTEVTGDHRILGAVFADDQFFISGGNNGLDRSFLYRFNRNGELLQRINQPVESPWGLHDLAWDGNFLYGGVNETIYVMDIEGQVIRTIRSPLIPPRGLTVDPNTGDIWVVNIGQTIRRLDSEGHQLAEYVHSLRPYGLTWREDDPDNSPLYIFSADGETNLALTKLNPVTGAFTPVAEITLEEGDRAGGCHLTYSWDSRRWVLVTVIQNSNGDRVEVFDAGPNFNWLRIDPDIATIPANQSVDFVLTLSAMGLLGGIHTADVRIIHNGPGGEVRIPVTIEVEPQAALVDTNTPINHSLSELFPNPTNGMSRITFSLPQSADVRMSIWDISGRIAADIINERMAAGNHNLIVDANHLTSGIYFVRLETGTSVAVRKFVLVK